ncbi:hypothetical protein ABZU32_39255 [Sphaerisporangium sp. NPDC005288]|uniref:hypothetical protein n=1 Tax=Sphaerisporangium sp. NPDC005288 TaxID=3155114 RepID=UPI0033A6CD5A
MTESLVARPYEDAVLLCAMRRMKALGMRTVSVNHDAENHAARELYRSLGFVKRHETHGYRRPVPDR